MASENNHRPSTTSGTGPSDDDDSFSAFPALQNSFFRESVELHSEPYDGIEHYFAEACNTAEKNKSGSDRWKTETSESGLSEQNKSRPRAAVQKHYEPDADLSAPPSHFSFYRRCSEKVGVDMTAEILDSNGHSTKYRALCLSLNESYALVSLDIDGKWVPTTCSKDAVPAAVQNHILSHLWSGSDIPPQDVIRDVAQCKRKGDQDGDTFFCATNHDSPFVAHVFDRDMYNSLLIGRVRFIRYHQSSTKTAYVYYCYPDNFGPGTLLQSEDVRHISTKFPGEFGRPDPKRVLVLAQLAKTYFMEKIMTKAKVLDRLESQARLDVASLDEHVLAVQTALGGSENDLVRRGVFVKCSVQLKRGTTRGNSGYVWRETPCFCDLEAVGDGPFVTDLKRIMSRRRSAHDRKRKEKSARESKLTLSKGFLNR